MIEDNTGQACFLDPIPEKPKKAAKKKAAKKKGPKKRVVKQEKKSKEESPPKGKIKLSEDDTFNNDSIIKKEVKKIIKHNNNFSIQKLLDRFDPRFIHIVVEWFKDSDNKTWIFHRMYNGRMKWNDPEYLAWKKTFDGEEVLI